MSANMLVLVAMLVCAADASNVTVQTDGVVGAYLLLEPGTGMNELAALAGAADTLPLNRIWLAFFSPNMIYEKGSKDLSQSGLDGAYDFNEIQKHIETLKQGGVEVFLSMGGSVE